MILAPPSDAHTMHTHNDNRRISASAELHQSHTIHTYGLCDMNLLIEHPNRIVRHSYRHKLYEKLMIVRGHIPYHHSHMLVFCATEEPIERDTVFKQLIILMQRARDHVQQREYALSAANIKSNDTQVMSTDQPEVWIFDFIYLLSYHPCTDETGIDQHNHQALSRIYDEICHYIDYFIDALLVGTKGMLI